MWPASPRKGSNTSLSNNQFVPDRTTLRQSRGARGVNIMTRRYLLDSLRGSFHTRRKPNKPANAEGKDVTRLAKLVPQK